MESVQQQGSLEENVLTCRLASSLKFEPLRYLYSVCEKILTLQYRLYKKYKYKYKLEFVKFQPPLTAATNGHALNLKDHFHNG